MRKLIAAVAVLLAVLLWPKAEAGSDCSIPQSWGAFRGVSHQVGSMAALNAPILFFEGSDGTIRWARADNCKPLGQITRQ